MPMYTFSVGTLLRHLVKTLNYAPGTFTELGSLEPAWNVARQMLAR